MTSPADLRVAVAWGLVQFFCALTGRDWYSLPKPARDKCLSQARAIRVGIRDTLCEKQ